MLISKKVEVGVSNKTITKYKNAGYTDIKQGDKIIIPIELLSKGSSLMVDVECDNCKKIFKKRYCLSHGKTYCEECGKVSYKLSCLEKYGVDNTSKLPEIHERIKETCKEKYGDKNYRNNEKRKETCLEKYNVENVFQLDETQDKFKSTCLEKYGVENPSQNAEIFSKQQQRRYEIKKHKETGLYYQGTYEKDFLDKYHTKLDIIKIEPIEYNYKKKKKKYHSDFYIPEYNLIVEIKSSYTFERYKKKNLTKERECEKLGYNFLFIIDKDYGNLENLFNN